MEMKIKIDFAEFGCERSFPCPECGEIISSEDNPGRTYTISEARIENGTIQDLRIRCNCGASIVLYRPADPPEGFKPHESFTDDCELEDPDYDLDLLLERLDDHDKSPADSSRRRLLIPFWD